MDNQHRELTGYRELSRAEIADINAIKKLGDHCNKIITYLDIDPGADARAVALAKTNLQQGLMWAVRAVAKPDSF